MYRSLYIAELAQGPKAMEHIFRWGYWCREGAKM
jgi:hypothetical protein